jgi:MFS superfamily sulfate permease-like transporter
MTVSLVSLPLSISLAIASDATPVQGIITAAWAGMVSAIFGGSHYNIVGPTGALSGILSYFSVKYGEAIQPLLALLVGLVCLIVWALSLHKYFTFIPGAVMHGFTLGVAFIIGLNQINFAFGLPKLPRHEKFLQNLYESLSHLGQTNYIALVFFLVCFVALNTLSRMYGKIPWAVVLALIGILIGYLQDVLETQVFRLSTIQTQYGDLVLELIMVSEFVTDGMDASFAVWLELIQGSLSIALVAVLETLISAFIADRMTKTLFNQRQEVLAVALSNIASGITGGIPATAALARTALNIKSGATSRAAGIVNGICIILLSTVLFDAFKYLPLPIIAAILVNVAVRMVEVPEIIMLYKMDKPMFAVCIITGLVAIVEDPTMGILVGAVLAMIRLLLSMRNSHADLQIYRGVESKMEILFENTDKKSLKQTTARLQGTDIDLEDDDEDDDDAHATEDNGEPLSKTSKLLKEMAKGTVGVTVVPKVKAPKVVIKYTPPGAYNAAGAVPKPGDELLPLFAVYTLPGYFTYISVQGHRDRIRSLFINKSSRLPEVTHLVFDMTNCYYADPDAIETIGELVEELRRVNVKVWILGFHARVRKLYSETHYSHEMDVFTSYGELLVHVRNMVATNPNGEIKEITQEHHVPSKEHHGHGHSHSHGQSHDVEAPKTATTAAGVSAASSVSVPASEPSTVKKVMDMMSGTSRFFEIPEEENHRVIKSTLKAPSSASAPASAPEPSKGKKETDMMGTSRFFEIPEEENHSVSKPAAAAASQTAPSSSSAAGTNLAPPPLVATVLPPSDGTKDKYDEW